MNFIAFCNGNLLYQMIFHFAVVIFGQSFHALFVCLGYVFFFFSNQFNIQNHFVSMDYKQPRRTSLLIK